MSVTLKPNNMKYRDPDTGNYKGVDVIAERTTTEQIAEIRSAGTAQKNQIQQKGEQTLATIPSEYTQMYDDLNVVRDDLAPVYDATATYAVGDLVTHDYQLYKCKTAIETAEAWTAAHWQIIDVDNLNKGIIGEIDNVKSALDDVTVNVSPIAIAGDYSNGDELFDKDDVPVLSVIRYSFDAEQGEAGYIDIRSTGDSRITYIGKGVSASGELHYEGTYTLPGNFGVAKAGTSISGTLHIHYLFVDQYIVKEISDVKKAMIPVSNQQNAVHLSRTDNQLDESHYIKGIGIDRGNNKFRYGDLYKLSKIIPLGDATDIKITATSGSPVVSTLTEPLLQDRFISDSYLVQGSRSILRLIGINYIVIDLTGCTGVKVAFGYGAEPSAATEDFAEGADVVYLNGVANEVNDKKRIQAIFGSSTANVLDLSDKIWGYKINNSTRSFVQDANSAISKFIYVGDISYDGAHVLTVSNYGMGGVLVIALLSEARIANDCIINTFLLTNSSRTISIPKGVNYAVIMVATNGIDYSKGIVVRKDSSTASVACKPQFLGWPGAEKDFATNIRYFNEDIRKLETLLLYRKWLPMAYGQQDSYTQGAPVVKRVNLMFFSDVHIDYGNAYESRQNVKDYAFIANNTPLKFDAVICGGDIMTRPNEKSQKISEMEDYFFDVVKEIEDTPVLWAVGNHDCNDMYHSPESGYTPDVSDAFGPTDYNDLWFDYAESTYGIVRQTRSNGYQSTYHYYDITAKKTRIICVDINDVDKSITEDGHVKYHGSVGFYISQEQMDWIINTAMNVNANQNWTIVFVMHQAQRLIGEDPANPAFYTPEGIPSAIEKLLFVCQAFNNGSTYSSTYTNEETSFNLSINVDYTALASKTVRPRIACWLVGHEHTDHYVKLHDINIIHIMHSLAYDYAYGNKNTSKTLGSFNQAAFDVVNIDSEERKIRMFRYGAGVDCYGDGGDRFLPDGLSY